MKTAKLLFVLTIMISLMAGCAITEEDRELKEVENANKSLVLARLAVDSDYVSVRHAAVLKLSDEDLLVQVAELTQDTEIRTKAINKLNEEVLAEMVLNSELEPDSHKREVCEAALARISDYAILARISIESNYRPIATKALERLVDQTKLAQLALENPLWYVRMVAAGELKDQALLCKIAMTDGSSSVCRIAVRGIKESKYLEEAALHITDKESLQLLLSKIEDKEMLERIAEGADSSPLRIAAHYKCGLGNWREIFESATSQEATYKEFDDALEAINICKVAKDTILTEEVRKACQRMIEKGDPLSVYVLIWAFNIFSEDWDANARGKIGVSEIEKWVLDYYESGQADLVESANNWISKHGYRIRSIPSQFVPYRPKWGAGH